MNWIKAGKTVSKNGTTVIYRAEGLPLAIESRKRHIPHANRGGTWDHTSYHLIADGDEVAQLQTLKAAKEFAETMMGGGKRGRSDPDTDCGENPGDEAPIHAR